MTSGFGRTNIEVSHRWVGLGSLIRADWLDALPPQTPVCVRGHEPLVGHVLKPRRDLVVATFSGFELERANDESHAHALTSALLVQHLSAMGRGRLDFFFLQLRRALEESVWSGFFGAVEDAREQGLVRFLGLEICGPVLGGLAQWRFHDAFEVVVTRGTPPEDWESVRQVAEERRVGIVATKLASLAESVRLSQDFPVEFRPDSLEQCAAWTGTGDN